MSRTSGTEPKVSCIYAAYQITADLWLDYQIKYYLEGSGSSREQVAQVLARVVDELRDEWMQAKLNNLGSPGA